jgi:hypothetical protein
MFGLVSATHAGTVTFDFDSGTPSSTSTPFTYTLGGVTASFSAVGDPGSYMIIDSQGLFVTLSGNILTSTTTPVGDLTISFDSPQSSITLDFVEADTSTVILTAMLGGKFVGASNATGSQPPGNDFPENALGFNSATFDSVVISTASATLGLDNISVTGAAASVPEPGSFLLGGGVLAILSLASRMRRKA